MKIANKITILVLLALGVVAFNTGVALYQLNRVQQELMTVASRDVALMEAVNALYQQQLEQKVLFEKLKAVSEELSAGGANETRRVYLEDYVRGLKHLCDLIVENTQVTIAKGRALLGIEARRLDGVEQGYQDYQKLIVTMIDEIEAGRFQLSFEHLEDFSNKESVLSSQLKKVLGDVEGWVQQSVARAQQLKLRTQQLLWWVFLLSVFICGLWAWFIMASIQEPLADLIEATHQVGKGDFVVRLKTDSKDEIAQVSQAFNTMSDQLQEFKQRLEDQNKTLASTNRELDRFVHTASHDIVGPLTAIVGYGAYLEQHHAHLLDDKGKDCLAGVRKGASRLNKLIKDLLELTRVSRIKNPYTQTAMSDVFEAALANCDFKIQETHTRIIVDQELPSIVCDRIKMTIVFTNLIGNAVKYSAKKNPQGAQVHVGYNPDAEQHEFYVKDNGIGISPEHHLDIFDMFARLHTTEYEGAGAGLAIVKAAIEDQGGFIRVESKPGEGAIFTVTIPKNLPPYQAII